MIGRFERNGKAFYGTISGGSVKIANSTHSLSELRVLAPTNPSKIICVGLNYVDHAQELEEDIPERPQLFLKPPSSVVGPGANIVYPEGSAQVDYEGELAIVIGRRCKNVCDPQKVVLGYTCFNDVTARDLQREDGQWTRAKSFDTFAPIGPFITKELDPLDVSILTSVNGRVKQNSTTKKLIFDPNYLVTFISKIMTLEAGDVIATGTPSGVGPLRPGDTVEVAVEHVGTLMNKVISQQDEGQSPLHCQEPNV